MAVFSFPNPIDRIFANVHDSYVRSGVYSWSPFGVTIGIFRSVLCVNQGRPAFSRCLTLLMKPQ